jgi:hypothetical protein
VRDRTKCRGIANLDDEVEVDEEAVDDDEEEEEEVVDDEEEEEEEEEELATSGFEPVAATLSNPRILGGI